MKFFRLCVLSLAALWIGAASSCAASAKKGAGADQAPIAIDADSLEVIQSRNQAIFKGNVIAKQGDMTLRSNVMTVFYNAKKPAASPANASALGSLSKIEVDGNVSLITATESATASHGRYDAVKNKVFLSEHVVLKRGGNVLNGSALEYDVVSGSSLLSGSAPAAAAKAGAPAATGTRVRGLFVPETKK